MATEFQGNIFKARHQYYACMKCNTPTPGPPSAADDAWYWQQHVLRIGCLSFLHLGLCDMSWLFAPKIVGFIDFNNVIYIYPSYTYHCKSIDNDTCYINVMILLYTPHNPMSL